MYTNTFVDKITEAYCIC